MPRRCLWLPKLRTQIYLYLTLPAYKISDTRKWLLLGQKWQKWWGAESDKSKEVRGSMNYKLNLIYLSTLFIIIICRKLQIIFLLNFCQLFGRKLLVSSHEIADTHKLSSSRVPGLVSLSESPLSRVHTVPRKVLVFLSYVRSVPLTWKLRSSFPVP